MIDLAIVAIAKNERRYFPEWLAFHRDQGVQRFFIYDNNSTDGTREYLNTLNDVIVFKWPFEQSQLRAYAHALEPLPFWQGDPIGRRLVECANWVAFIDLDEFLFSPTGLRLPEVLKRYEASSIGSVVAHWCLYGTSGHVFDSADPVTMRFTYRATNPDAHVKTIVRTANGPHTISSNPHRFTHLRPGLTSVDENGLVIPDKSMPTENITANILRINHYALKSEQEFKRKLRVPRADNGWMREEANWRECLDKNEVEDKGIAYQWGRNYHERNGGRVWSNSASSQLFRTNDAI